MKDIFKSNIFYGIASVILAIFLLFYVDSMENPISEKTFNSTLAARNLSSDLLLDETPISVKVRVSSNKTSFYAITSKDIKTWVDLTEAKPGLGTYPIQSSLPAGVSLIWIEPREMDLYLDQMGSKNIPLKPMTINEVAGGFGNFEPVLTPASVSVTGPKLLLDSVDHGVVQIDLSGLKSDYVAELPVSLVGKNDQVVENAQIKVDQPKVKAQVTITENMSSKSVQIRPAITGEIQESWLVSSVEVKPTTVRITGAFDLIKDIEYLTTDTIDLTLLEDSFSGKINLNIPEGVGVLDGTQVDVNIKLIKNLIKRTISGLPIEVRNAPANKNYGTLPTQVDVELQAFPWVFAGRSTTEGGYDIPVKPFVDLGGEPANSKDYEIQIECPPEFEVLTISTKTVRVHQ